MGGMVLCFHVKSAILLGWAYKQNRIWCAIATKNNSKIVLRYMISSTLSTWEMLCYGAMRAMHCYWPILNVSWIHLQQRLCLQSHLPASLVSCWDKIISFDSKRSGKWVGIWVFWVDTQPNWQIVSKSKNSCSLYLTLKCCKSVLCDHMKQKAFLG